MSEESSLIQSRKKRKSNCGQPSAKVIKHGSFSCCIVIERYCLNRPMRELQAFLDDYSKRPFNPWEYGTLTLVSLLIQRSMIALLRPLLYYCDDASSIHDDDASNNIDTSPGCASTTQNKFSSARLDGTRFLSVDDINYTRNYYYEDPDHDHEICTHDEKVCFLVALARCSKALEITSGDAIVSGLLNIPEIDHLEAEILKIEQMNPFTHLEYARLDTILQNSVKLTELTLKLPYENVPQSFCDSFANFVHIQSLCMSLNNETDDSRGAFGTKMVANKYRNGAIERLLRNPQNQLKKLDLSSTSLEDYHVMVIAELLPTSHVEEIDLGYNEIQAPGLLEFARQLPKMRSLTELRIEGNPWELSSLEVIAECGAALFHGLMENPSMGSLYSMENFPHYRLLWEYSLWNDSVEDILTSFKVRPIPEGLWPYVLSLAGRPCEIGAPRLNEMECDDSDERMDYVDYSPVNAMYFFLQDCPERFSSYIR